ncbi:MAG: DNA-3-methyladenine glycosylase family protein, partial [Paraclostridium sp.]
MKVYEKDDMVILEGVSDFDPKHIFECGQCFRWRAEEDGSYTGVAKGKVVNVSRENDTIYIKNSNLEDFNNIWKNYFDLETNYAEIKNILKNMDDHLAKATEFGWGIRLLKQDPWEMIISFIISSNNRIPMIQRAIGNLSKKYGTYIGEYNGIEYYDFPTPEQLNKATIEDIRACSTGFRDKYIKSTTEAVITDNDDVYNYSNLSTDECRKELMKFNGIGPKVCD